MNCKKVEELLPLYVGRDLTEENARLVTTHLHGCTQCALSAREYGEANQLLQMFEPPQFSDAAYAAVRSSVWREIERKSSAPRLIEFFKRPLPLHVTWAGCGRRNCLLLPRRSHEPTGISATARRDRWARKTKPTGRTAKYWDRRERGRPQPEWAACPAGTGKRFTQAAVEQAKVESDDWASEPFLESGRVEHPSRAARPGTPHA